MNDQASSRFSNSGEVEQISQYRRFNVAAIVALVLGLASSGVLVSPFLWIIPLLTIFVGALGLFLQYRRDDMGGSIPAWCGIALALFLSSWAASQLCFERCVLYSEALVVGQDWLHLVADGEDKIAHQGMLSINTRQAPELSVDEYYAMDEKASSMLKGVFSDPPYSQLLNSGEGSEDVSIKLLKNVQIVRDLDSILIQQVFRISPSDAEPIDTKLTVMRSFNEDLDQATWIIREAEDNDEPPPNVIGYLSTLVTKLVGGAS